MKFGSLFVKANIIILSLLSVQQKCVRKFYALKLCIVRHEVILKHSLLFGSNCHLNVHQLFSHFTFYHSLRLTIFLGHRSSSISVQWWHPYRYVYILLLFMSRGYWYVMGGMTCQPDRRSSPAGRHISIWQTQECHLDRGKHLSYTRQEGDSWVEMVILSQYTWVEMVIICQKSWVEMVIIC